jgi:hypothetical protein
MAQIGSARNGAAAQQPRKPGEAAVRDALYEAVLLALVAPSIANSQPWRWHLHRHVSPGGELAESDPPEPSDVADLYSDRSRQLVSIDPLGRLMVVSCGAALHHAVVALAGRGMDATVRRLPDPRQPDLMARLAVAGERPLRPEDRRAQRSIQDRHSDRRPFLAGEPLSEPVLAELVGAARADGVWARPVDPRELHLLGLAASSAAKIEAHDPAYQDELKRRAASTTGGAVLPDTTVPATPRPVPMRSYAGPATLAPGEGDDRFAVYLVVCTDGDEQLDWLRAGEAASACLLAATSAGLASSVMSEVIEVPGARALIRGVVHSGHPQLVLRLGRQDTNAAVPASPRRPANEMIAVDPPR